MGLLYVFLLVGAFVVFIYKKIPVLNYRFPFQVEIFQPFVFAFLVAYGVIYGIVAMTRYATCASGPRGYFESFQGFAEAKQQQEPQEPQDQLVVLKQRVEAATERALTNVERISSFGDQTCDLVRQAEDSYVGAMAGPEDESEYSLPAEEQQRRQTARATKARDRFARLRRIFSGDAFLECFQGSQEASMSDAEVELRAALQSLQDVLESPDSLILFRSPPKIAKTLQFTNSMLDRGAQEMEKAEGFQAPSLNPVAAPQAVARVQIDMLSLEELKAYALQLLQQEDRANTRIRESEMLLQKTQGRFTDAQRKMGAVETGQVSAADIQSSLSA